MGPQRLWSPRQWAQPRAWAGRVWRSHFAEQLDQAAVLCPVSAHRCLNLSSCKTLVVFSFQTTNSLRKVKTPNVAVSINSEFMVILAFGATSLSASQLTSQMPSTPGRDSGWSPKSVGKIQTGGRRLHNQSGNNGKALSSSSKFLKPGVWGDTRVTDNHRTQTRNLF